MITLTQFLKQFNDNLEVTPLIKQAFYHSSYVNEKKELNLEDNERLEFVGDAVLQLYTATFLYKQQPTISEGDMTLIRAKLVSEKGLAEYSRRLDLGAFLKLGQGELKNKGYLRDSILADLFEAFIGAIYLSYGYEAIIPFLEATLHKNYAQLDPDDLMDYKTKLQELLQSDLRKSVIYTTIQQEGNLTQPLFVAYAKMDELVLGVGQGLSKKKAQQNAAKNALEKLAK